MCAYHCPFYASGSRAGRSIFYSSYSLSSICSGNLNSFPSTKSKGEEKTQMVIVFLLIRSVGSGNRRKLARCVDSVRVRVPPSSRSPDVDRYTAHKKKRKRMPPCRHVSFLSVRNGIFQRFILSNIDRRVPQQLVFFPTIPLF
jgi:hypothetical protein